jgi:nucleoside-diphosphate-sugar epimerase
MTGRLFVFGLGYSGLAIARLAKSRGWSVAGTVRMRDKAERLAADGIAAHLFDGTQACGHGRSTAPAMLCTIAPGTADPVLGTCSALLGEARWLGYLSTTGVYGDQGGGWVNEATPTYPTKRATSSARGRAHLMAGDGRRPAPPLCYSACPGIYGPGAPAPSISYAPASAHRQARTVLRASMSKTSPAPYSRR